MTTWTSLSVYADQVMSQTGWTKTQTMTVNEGINMGEMIKLEEENTCLPISYASLIVFLYCYFVEIYGIYHLIVRKCKWRYN